ncbi:MAG: hypothetical protein QFB86_01175 [Patescibacteria group bacterium]|nr:hypothetical protein [Patescibacteria group bacterium]
MKKLDTRGVAHQIALIAFVVLFAVVGVGYLVASHADSCNPPSSVSGAVSSSVSSPVSGGNCATSNLACTINGVPANPVKGQIVRPTFTVTNAGKTKVAFNAYTDVLAYNNPTKGGVLSSKHFSQKLRPGSTSTHKMKSYKVAYASATVSKIEYDANFVQNGYQPACSAVMTLPIKPAQ